jgi:hypothetical protein
MPELALPCVVLACGAGCALPCPVWPWHVELALPCAPLALAPAPAPPSPLLALAPGACLSLALPTVSLDPGLTACTHCPDQVKEEGYEVQHEGRLITVFSAPNYCDQVSLRMHARCWMPCCAMPR